MTKGLKSYPSMQETGVNWFGMIPAGWRAQRLKTVCTMRSGDAITANSIEAEGKYPVYGGNGLRGYTSDCTHDGAFVLIGRQGALCGNVHVVSGRFWASEHAVVTTAHAENSARWLGATLEVMNLNQHSIAAAQPGLAVERILNLWLPVPSIVEQTAIARFLDHMDRRIQKYIRAKEKLIALLDEYKQALIHQAVTGQVDVRTGRPYPEYRESGVEWLGRIPGHWETCRLRTVVSEVTTGSRGWSSFAADQGPLFLRIANLSRGSLRLRFDDVVRLKLPNTSEAIRTRVEPGDILLSVTAYIGSVGIASSELGEAYVSQHVARCKPKSGALPHWLGYVLLSKIGQTHGQLSLYGGTKDGLSLDDVKNYPILLPPMQEQRDIVRWVERKINLATKATEHAHAQLERVREYRARLIADVVTGKLDVREAAVGLRETDSPVAEPREA